MLRSVFPLGLPLVFLALLFGFVLIAIFVLVRAIGALRAFGAIGLAACAPYCLIGAGAFWGWQTLVSASLRFGDYAHFQLNRSSYDKQVDAIPTINGPRFVRFEWPGFMLNPNEVLFDESDEVVLPEDQRSEAWKERVGIRSEYYACRFGVQPVAKHYYVISFSC